MDTDQVATGAPPVARLRRGWWRQHFGFLIAVGAFAIYLATGSYADQSIDVMAAEEPAWALATRGTLDLSGIEHHALPWYFEHDGAIYSDRFPGAILYLVPGYWLAAALGVTWFSQAPGVVTAAAAAAATVGVLYQVLCSVLPGSQARVAALFVAFGTGTWSLAADSPWSHTIGQLCVALILLALSRDRVGLAALASGILALTRPVQAVASAVLGATMAWQRRSPGLGVRFAALAAPGLLLLFAFNALMYGTWGPSNGHELAGTIVPRPLDLPVNVVGTLVSPTRGLVFYYPFLLVAPLGFAAAWRSSRDWERSALLAGVSGLLAQLALNQYSGGDVFFGNRLAIEGLTFAVPILARSVAHVVAGPYRRVMLATLVLGVAIHAAGSIVVPV